MFLGTGKTTLAKKLLINSGDIFERPINRLIFVFGGAHQVHYDEIKAAIPNHTFIDGWDESILANPQLYKSDGVHETALVVDDCIGEAGNSKFMTECFVKFRSRLGLNIILLSQVIFQADLKSLRTISRNATGLFLLRNHRGRQSLKCLASQMGIDNLQSFMKCFEDATNEFGYLYCDLQGWLDTEILRYRSGLLPGEQSTCYDFITS